jgi:hypothetical protein
VEFEVFINTGRGNTSGNGNTFIGRLAGRFNTFGNNNTFIGKGAGDGNISGNNNTVLGADADVTASVDFATAIGAGASVSSSNTVVIGRTADLVKVPGKILLPNVLGLKFSSGTRFLSGSDHICVGPDQDDTYVLGFCSDDPPNASAVRSNQTLINAIKEQQTKIETLERQNLSQVKQMDTQKLVTKQLQDKLDKQAQEYAALKRLVCSSNPTASLCQPQN